MTKAVVTQQNSSSSNLISPENPAIVVLISAGGEWRAVKKQFPQVTIQTYPYGEWFQSPLGGYDSGENLVFVHGGWGKISAAASAQYAVDRWAPRMLVNLGTCGGFEGRIERGEIVLVEKAIVYDIIEQMGDYDAHIGHYTTTIDLSWLQEPYPQPVRRDLIVSGDRDILAQDIPWLVEKFGAVAGDWESGSIAFVANKNQVRLLILRGVTDLVNVGGGEAYGNLEFFHQAAEIIMEQLIQALPGWLKAENIS